MSLFKILWRNLAYRRVPTLLTALSAMFGVMLVLWVLHLQNTVNRELNRPIMGSELIVSVAGSPLELTLNTLFNFRVAAGIGSSGLVDYPSLQALQKLPGVATAVPWQTGDQYHGFRVIGTSAQFFQRYAFYKFSADKALQKQSTLALAEGAVFKSGSQIVAGYETARQLGLKTGQKINIQHDMSEQAAEHDEPFTVSGILEQTGTAADRALYVDYHDLDGLHEEQTGQKLAGGVDAVLIQMKGALYRFSLPAMIKQTFPGLMAVEPRKALEKLTGYLDAIHMILYLLALAVVTVAALGLFLSLYNSIDQRRHELQLYRSHGAPRRFLFILVLSEGLAVLVIALGSGLAAGQLSLGRVLSFLEQSYGFSLSSLSIPVGFWPFAAGLLVAGLLGSCLPALMAYRQNR